MEELSQKIECKQRQQTADELRMVRKKKKQNLKLIDVSHAIARIFRA